ncbi:hypothetical protein NQ176_g7163 [Zarea fungicola]|uniref:Uncharacterized protein n=1 Tax=Zarea fungicola TaxID=93591 RepID=A0ACC1MZK4_9HYPO|nr:hypothetical protein NQ176_g7163 [Lecanicillium fungicola]
MQVIITALGALALAAGASAQASLLKAKGFGTYYYDIKQRQACGSDFNLQNQGSVMCNWIVPKSLNDVNSDNLVAMSNLPLKTPEGRAKYCGKRVKVTVNGVTSNIPFFIGDGCERCAHGSDSVWNPNGAAGLDFSYSALSALSPLACQNGHIDIQYEIVNETLYHFDTN